MFFKMAFDIYSAKVTFDIAILDWTYWLTIFLMVSYWNVIEICSGQWMVNKKEEFFWNAFNL